MVSASGRRRQVALATTKIPILMKSGFWTLAHEARADYAMLLGAVFLLSEGAGRLSLDSRVGLPHLRSNESD